MLERTGIVYRVMQIVQENPTLHDSPKSLARVRGAFGSLRSIVERGARVVARPYGTMITPTLRSGPGVKFVYHQPGPGQEKSAERRKRI